MLTFPAVEQWRTLGLDTNLFDEKCVLTERMHWEITQNLSTLTTRLWGQLVLVFLAVFIRAGIHCSATDGSTNRTVPRFTVAHCYTERQTCKQNIAY